MNASTNTSTSMICNCLVQAWLLQQSSSIQNYKSLDLSLIDKGLSMTEVGNILVLFFSCHLLAVGRRCTACRSPIPVTIGLRSFFINTNKLDSTIDCQSRNGQIQRFRRVGRHHPHCPERWRTQSPRGHRLYRGVQ